MPITNMPVQAASMPSVQESSTAFILNCVYSTCHLCSSGRHSYVLLHHNCSIIVLPMASRKSLSLLCELKLSTCGLVRKDATRPGCRKPLQYHATLTFLYLSVFTVCCHSRHTHAACSKLSGGKWSRILSRTPAGKLHSCTPVWCS